MCVLIGFKAKIDNYNTVLGTKGRVPKKNANVWSLTIPAGGGHGKTKPLFRFFSYF